MMRKVALLSLACILLIATFSPGVLAAVDFEARSGQTVRFQGWQFATDVVLDTVRRYNETMGGNVEYNTIAGDYSAIMEQKFIAGDAPDILYGHVYDAVRYFDGGWIEAIDSLPNADEILADLIPSVAEAWTYKGKVLGLPYFTSVIGILVTNLDRMEECGLTEADYPKTWDEFYELIHALHEQGVENPYLPAWYSEQWGIGWSFLAEVLNRGGVTADPETHEPRLTADGPGGDTLRAWKRLWNEGVVDKEVLSYRETDHIEAWESGRYLFASHMAYNIRRSNDPKFSQVAGRTGFVPYQGQPWGILDVGLYLITKKDRDPDFQHDVEAFFSWYGFKNEEGRAYVAERWLQDFMLFSGYQSVMSGEIALEAIRSSLANPDDVDKMIELYENASYPKGVFNVTWSPEFQSFLREELQSFLLNDKPVEQTIEAINSEIARLNKVYGIN